MTRLSSPRALRRARLAGRALAALVVTFTLGVGAAGASPSTDGFELVRPTVTINGVASEFSGTLRAESFGAFSVEAAGYGRVLFSTAPFAGARAEGRLNSTMLLAAEPGQIVVVTSQGDVVTPSRRQTLYVRFDLETGAHAPAPGFEVRLTLAADVSSLAADATPRPRSALEALPDTTMPELIGGLAALQQAIVYPRIQREAGIEGRTFVQFVVSEAGTPRSVQVVRSAGDPALDASAVAAVEAARFRPGTVEGRPVPVRFAIPITFRLGDAPPAQPPMPNGVDTMPELIGGLEALQQAVVYPEVQRRAGIEGTAFVRFVVSPSGAVQDAEVARGTGDEALDAAAVAAVESVTFRPGTKGGRAVAVEFVVPVRFVLPDADGR